MIHNIVYSQNDGVSIKWSWNLGSRVEFVLSGSMLTLIFWIVLPSLYSTNNKFAIKLSELMLLSEINHSHMVVIIFHLIFHISHINILHLTLYTSRFSILPSWIWISLTQLRNDSTYLYHLYYLAHQWWGLNKLVSNAVGRKWALSIGQYTNIGIFYLAILFLESDP